MKKVVLYHSVRSLWSARSARLGGLRLGSALALLGVGLVVVFVSLPCLRDWALRENERDAIRFARHLASLVKRVDTATLLDTVAPVPTDGAALPAGAPSQLLPTQLRRSGSAPPGLRMAELIAVDPTPKGALADADFLASGALRRRGYLFDVVAHAEAGCVVRAWPWEQGQTGLGAFVAVPDGPIFGLANEDSRCSGPEHPPRVDAQGPRIVEASWKPLKR